MFIETSRKTPGFEVGIHGRSFWDTMGVGLDVYVCIWNNVYIYIEKEKPMLRASQETRQQLKVIAALTGETMQAVLARLIKAEYDRVKVEK